MNKKIILCVLIVIALLISILMCTVGFLGVPSLSKLKTKTEDYKTKQAEVEDAKNAYNEKNQKLTISLNDYETTKKEYEDSQKSSSGTSKGKKSTSETYYKLDNIWSFSKKIAKKQNVKISLDCKTSPKVSDSKDYMYANLEYKISGEYKPVIDFMVAFGNGKYDFKISDFKLEDYVRQAGDNEEEVSNYVQATFTVKNVPLSSKDLNVENN